MLEVSRQSGNNGFTLRHERALSSRGGGTAIALLATSDTIGGGSLEKEFTLWPIV